MDPKQLEDADRRGFNPYAHAGTGGIGSEAVREHLARLTVAEAHNQAQENEEPSRRRVWDGVTPTESAAQSADSQPVEPEPGTVVGFTKRFRPDGPGYAYVAIRIKGRGWFLTGELTYARTWAELLEFADGAQLWVTREWTKLGES